MGPVLETLSAASPSHWGHFLATTAPQHSGTHPEEERQQIKEERGRTLLFICTIRVLPGVVELLATHLSKETEEREDSSRERDSEVRVK